MDGLDGLGSDPESGEPGLVAVKSGMRAGIDFRGTENDLQLVALDVTSITYSLPRIVPVLSVDEIPPFKPHPLPVDCHARAFRGWRFIGVSGMTGLPLFCPCAAV